MIPSRLFAGSAFVLFGVAAVAPGQNELHASINHALDQARPALLAHLKAADEGPARCGELALLALAAIHDGVDPASAVLASALRQLGKAEPEQTYDIALRLLVLEVSPTFPDRLDLARRDVQQLLKHRTNGGAFAYAPKGGRWDLSNTQYGALGLRAARAIGVDTDRSVWLKISKTVGDQQGSYGGFGYTDRGGSRGDESYASMTAAGIAVLAICREHLGDGGQDTELEKRIARGWQWFDRNATVIGSAAERWSYYFHYGLERAAILCDKEKVGGDDWYAKGARMLVAAQLTGGGWISDTDGYQGTVLDRGRGHGTPTAFAVLFLRRKFQKAAGPITPHIVTLAAVGPMSKQADVDACTAELVRRGKPALPDVLKALRSEIEQQRRAAGTALVQLAGEGFGFDPARDQDRNRDAIRKAELWYLKNR